MASRLAHLSNEELYWLKMILIESMDSTGRMGAKRKELVEKFGYDTKNASHLIRLLKMGIEALTTGELLIERPDNNMLLEIKRGEWKLERVLKLSDSYSSR